LDLPQANFHLYNSLSKPLRTFSLPTTNHA
jgi:hypothetical protein